MSLQNEYLRTIKNTLLPQQQHDTTQQSQSLNQTTVPVSPASNTVLSSTSSSSPEFIPHLYYSLYQIRKDPNNATNQLETSTGFIRHRLKTCKSLIEDNADCKKLLAKSTDDWNVYLKQQEAELEVKKKVLHDLSERIKLLTSTSSPKNSFINT
ncbi:hypothetical protein NCAS_0A04670 [Naumovozyma castellii]|uniref:Mediator of RNA polymerase II transcription subunit 9 n=1 Tax=Naumovozyma castellii TaxID=27288 RepID=G0V6D3_NAUCA|nr:hypothetical protein NCAS_0A04670 [Naumovozyma castellii CBS 4309]CCC67025.1 hypothetical protein NCAS_0A04670 [Naumovozyma castellii CBS 4309]